MNADTKGHGTNDDLTITVKDVDMPTWKAARKYGIDKGLSMGEVVTNALRAMLTIAEKDSRGGKTK